MADPTDPHQLELDLGLTQHQKDVSELHELRQINAEKMRYLLSEGMRPDPTGLAMLRLNTFLDVCLSGPERTVFELAFEKAMVDVLEQCLAQAPQVKLMHGVTPQPNGKPASGLIIPGH